MLCRKPVSALAFGWCTNPTHKRGPTGFSTEQVEENKGVGSLSAEMTPDPFITEHSLAARLSITSVK
jgi:hypothetical protein